MDENLEVQWNSVTDSSGMFLCPRYLRSIEDSHDKGLELRYALFYIEERLVGAAAFQITHFSTSADAYSNPVLRFLHRSVQYLKLGHVHNILICGNAIATGEHGFHFKSDISDAEASAMIAKAMKMIAAEEKAKNKRICAMVAKDFYPASKQVAKELEKAGFKSFQVEHNMVMPVLDEWHSFDDYLQSLVTKFRTKAKAAFNKSASLTIENRSRENIQSVLPQLQKLYENVHHKADFRLGKMSLDALPLLLEELPENFFVKTYSLNGEVVGFMSAMRCGKTLEAHIIGINYEQNKEHAVYQRILYDYIALAIEQRCGRIVFGRTAAEIKSTIGALPVDLTCAILHQRKISNALLKMILQYVGPSEYEHRQPYKADVLKLVQAKPVY